MLNTLTLAGALLIVASYALQPTLYTHGLLKFREYQVIGAHVVLAPTGYGLCKTMAAHAAYPLLGWVWSPGLWVCIVIYCVIMIRHKLEVVNTIKGGR